MAREQNNPKPGRRDGRDQRRLVEGVVRVAERLGEVADDIAALRRATAKANGEKGGR